MSNNFFSALAFRPRCRPRPFGGGWAALLLLLAWVCVDYGSAWSAPPAAEAGRRAFETRGIVREIAPNRKKAVIRHEEIPGYMPRMTMELNVREPRELEKIKVGDEVLFTLVATEDQHWIERIRKTGKREDKPAAPAPKLAIVPDLKPGDEVPDFEFMAEDGHKLRLKEFRGRSLAFTFFFTRCPIPEFCPRMSKSFAAARELMLQRTAGPTNWQFLCLSFDADFDKPVVLAGYASAYRGTNKTGWLFGAVQPDALARVARGLDFSVTKEEGGFSHNLRTVVLDGQGRIHRQFDGNDWTPAQLAAALTEAAVVGVKKKR